VFERDLETKRVVFSQRPRQLIRKNRAKMPNINAGPQEQILPLALGFWKARALAVAKRMSAHLVDQDDAFTMNDTKVNITQIANVHTRW
jgi:hypothetical protein